MRNSCSIIIDAFVAVTLVFSASCSGALHPDQGVAVAAPPSMFRKPPARPLPPPDTDRLAAQGQGRWLVEECRALIGVIDTEQYLATRPGKHKGPARIGAALKGAAAAIGRVTLGSRVLQELRDDYRTLLSRAANMTGEKPQTARPRWIDFVTRERALIDRINEHCMAAQAAQSPTPTTRSSSGTTEVP